MQVEVLGVPAPERGRLVERRAAAIGARLITAGLIVAREAQIATATGNQDLDGDAVAHVHAPAPGGVLADFLDDAEWLVTRDRGPATSAHMPQIALDVAAADAAALDA